MTKSFQKTTSYIKLTPEELHKLGFKTDPSKYDGLPFIEDKDEIYPIFIYSDKCNSINSITFDDGIEEYHRIYFKESISFKELKTYFLGIDNN